MQNLVNVATVNQCFAATGNKGQLKKKNTLKITMTFVIMEITIQPEKIT